MGAGGTDYALEEVPVRGGSALAGRTLRDAAVRERYGCSILAVRREGRLEPHPSAETVLQPGDVLVVVGNEQDAIRMRQQLT